MNVLLETWETPFGLPPFDQITDADFAPAIEVAMAEARAAYESDERERARVERERLKEDLDGRGL